MHKSTHSLKSSSELAVLFNKERAYLPMFATLLLTPLALSSTVGLASINPGNSVPVGLWCAEPQGGLPCDSVLVNLKHFDFQRTTTSTTITSTTTSAVGATTNVDATSTSSGAVSSPTLDGGLLKRKIIPLPTDPTKEQPESSPVFPVKSKTTTTSTTSTTTNAPSPVASEASSSASSPSAVQITSSSKSPSPSPSSGNTQIKPSDCGTFLTLSTGNNSQVVSIAGFYESDTPETFSNISPTVWQGLGVNVLHKGPVSLDYTVGGDSFGANRLMASTGSSFGCRQ